MKVWLNGEFVPESDAVLSVFDSSIQHAVGLFETMSAVNGRIFRVHDHTQRLTDSARTLLLSNRLQPGPLAEAADQLIEANNMTEARVRLTVTGGNLKMPRQSEEGHVDPTVLIVAQPPTDYPAAFFTQGVDVSIASGRENPWTPMAGHKTLNYWPRIHALQMAGMMGSSEALWLDPDANLTAGSVSNIFIVRDGELITPLARGEQEDDAQTPPVLPGITRQAILELAQTAGIAVNRKTVPLDRLLSADEVFLTNSSWQVLPVKGVRLRTRQQDGETGVETRTISDGSVGQVTQQLRRDLQALIDRQTRD